MYQGLQAFAIGCCLAVLALTGCTTTNRISQDFREDTNFQQYHSFSWHNYDSEIAESNQLAIQAQVEAVLMEHGFKHVEQNADLQLDMHVIKQRNAGESNGRVGLSVGLPLGAHGALGVGTSNLLGAGTQTNALIILDITAAKTNQVIWRGTADAVPLSYLFARNQPQINSILRQLVGQFPPVHP